MSLVNPGIEELLYSVKIKKFNKFDWIQERSLIVTAEAIYNFKKNSKVIKFTLQ